MNCFIYKHTVLPNSTIRLIHGSLRRWMAATSSPCESKVFESSNLYRIVYNTKSKLTLGHLNRLKPIMCFSVTMVPCRTISTSHFLFKIRDGKASKRSNASNVDANDDVDSDDDDDTDDEYEDDRGAENGLPTNYRLMKVHSLRAMTVVAKGLGMSNSEAEEVFYNSKMFHQGSVLTKKAKQLTVGEHVDVVVDKSAKEIFVKRVKVVHIAKRLTRTGKPIVTLKAWRNSFDTNKI